MSAPKAVLTDQERSGEISRERNDDSCGAWVAVDPNDRETWVADISRAVVVHCTLGAWHRGLHAYSTEFMTVTWHV